MARVFDGRLSVHYGQAYIVPPGEYWIDLEDSFRGQVNGLCGAASPHSLFLITGLHTGKVGFTLDVLDKEPALDNSWEEIVEVPFVAQATKYMLQDWDGKQVCAVPLLPGNYRARYCARNMDLGHEVDTLVEGEPIDFYYLAFWPAAIAPDVVLKQTSESAAYWHQYANNIKT